MEVQMQDVALVLAGVIGSVVAVIHGVLVRRKMAAPLSPILSDPNKFPPTIARLTPLLLDFSGYNWLVGGLALIAAPYVLETEAIVAVSVLVGSSYLFASIGNCWGTWGRHPGWVLYAIATMLVIFGAWRPLA